jgi:Mitochondrial mRNA-processing protein COX24, C-terminal
MLRRARAWSGVVRTDPSVQRNDPTKAVRRGVACMGSVIKKRRKKMSKHKYRKRVKANRHKRKK